MPTITISRELGSQGSQIAENAAKALGYHFMDKNSIGEVMEEYGLVEFHHEYEVAPSVWDFFDIKRKERRDEMIDMLNRVILALAQHGNMVILGRCGFAVLHDYADVLNVRIQAPLEMRIKQVMGMKRFSSIDQAEAFVKENDQVRTSFIESFYGVKWDSATAFDVVIDASKISPEMATEWLIAAAREMASNIQGDDKTTASISVDRTLTSTIYKALDCHTDHKK
jgi:cytidylate kinase